MSQLRSDVLHKENAVLKWLKFAAQFDAFNAEQRSRELRFAAVSGS